ncbi:MAG: hypothetical protein ACYTEQ_27280 [Planctomycetota bacterium]|jgi:hypothetical protein
MNELKRRGYDEKQIETALEARNMLAFEQKKVGRTAGGVLGGTAAAMALNLIPGFAGLPEEKVTVPLGIRIGKSLARLGAGGLTAGTGGMAGEAAEKLYVKGQWLTPREALSSFGTEFGLDVGGAAIAGTGLKFGSLFARKTKSAVIKTLDDFARVGGYYDPAQMDDRLWIRAMTAISRGSLGGQQIYKRFGDQQQAALLRLAEDNLQAVSKGARLLEPTELAGELHSMLSRPHGYKLKVLGDLTDPLYAKVAQQNPNAQVNVRGLRNYAKQLLASHDEAVKVGGETLDTGLEASLRKYKNAKHDWVSFPTFRKMRTKMREAVDTLTYLHGEGVQTRTGLLRKANAIFYDPSQYRNMSRKGHRLLGKANAYTRALEAQYDKHFKKAILRRLDKSDTRVLNTILPDGNGDVAKELKRFLTHTPTGAMDELGVNTWNQMRAAKLAEGITAASKEGRFDPGTFQRWIKKSGGRQGVNSEYMKTLYSKSERDAIRNVFDIGEAIKPMGSEGTSLFSKGLQIGGAQQMLGAGTALLGMTSRGPGGADEIAIGTGGFLLVSPVAFALLATSRGGSRLLTKQWRMIPGTKAAMKNSARIISLFTRIKQDEIDAEMKERMRQIRERGAPERKKEQERMDIIRARGLTR